MKKISSEDALAYHSRGRKGKIQVVPTKPTATQWDLSLAYSPGVAIPCKEIERDPLLAYEYTAKGNLVAVISPGIIRKYPMKMESLACKLNRFYKDKRPAPDEISRYLDPEIVNKEITIKCP